MKDEKHISHHHHHHHRHGRPRVPRYMRASLITACGALLFGLDTGTIGPVTTMSAFTATFGPLSATVHGIVVSSILLPAAIAALLAGILADRYGRIRIIVQGAVIFGVGAALETAAPKLPVFIVGRIVKGVGEGLFLSTVFVQVCEISPAKVRGTMASVPQFLTTLGLVLGFFMCYGTARLGGEGTSSLSWRLPIAIQSFLAFVWAAAAGTLVPPSPRWLLAKGRTEKATLIISQLGIGAAEQEELLAQSEAGLEHPPDMPFMETVKHTLRDFRIAFSAPFRARTTFGCFLMAMQQFSGIDGVLYYAPILFQQAGFSSEEATFLASGMSAVVIAVVTIPATLLADKWGRKTSVLSGGCLITFLMLLMGSLYAADEVQPDSGAGRWVVIVSIYLFACVFSFTWAISFRTFLIESLPRQTRSSGASLAQSSNWVANYIVALTTPVFISTSTFGAYYFFAFSTLLCTVVCAFFMFETQGHSLEVIEKRYLERQTKATGTWKVDLKGFRLRKVRPIQS